MNAIRLQQLSYNYGSQQALCDLHLEIQAGECVALLGPNGAGKSTLLQLLTGQLILQKGRLEIFGSPVATLQAADMLGYAPQDVEFPKNLTVMEILNWVSAHRQMRSRDSKILLLLESFQLQHLLSRKGHHLSGGERKRLSLACAFLGNPPLVILDEPTNHLDLHSRQALSVFLKSEKQKGTCILFASHYMAEVQEMAERVCVLHEGRLLQDTTPQTLCDQWGIHKIQFQAPLLNFIPDEDINNFVDQWEIQNQQHTIWSHQPDELVRHLVRNNVDFSQLQIEKANLEDVLKTVYHQAVQS